MSNLAHSTLDRPEIVRQPSLLASSEGISRSRGNQRATTARSRVVGKAPDPRSHAGQRRQRAPDRSAIPVVVTALPAGAAGEAADALRIVIYAIVLEVTPGSQHRGESATHPGPAARGESS
jgi:hypothetical protein